MQLDKNHFRSILFIGAITPMALLAQSHDDHSGHGGGHGHAHMGQTVSCENLAAPPWNGLAAQDRDQIADLRSQLSSLKTPEAAKAAGFFPALGDIPGMGVHYVNLGMGLEKKIDPDLPNQLLFSNIDGQDQLVGAAYAFVDVPNTDVPLPYDSDLASWHDHPQFAKDGETLHMLHVWFVESSNGPFAGLNFWLPYQTAGLEVPNPCWMADEDVADRIRKVSFALTQFSWDGAESTASEGAVAPAEDIQTVADQTGLNEEVVEAIVSEPDGASGATWNKPPELTPARKQLVAALDVAVTNDDATAWSMAADKFLADLTEDEMNRVLGTLGILGENQMSSAQRDEAGIAQPGSR